MSVRNSVLALLKESPAYGYQLKVEFDRRTGGTWPLNVGQVYTTLDRLDRDGLVEAVGRDERRRARYAITAAGLDVVDHWLTDPVDREGTARDELAMKLAIAATLPDVDVRRIIQVQRSATYGALQALTRLKATSDEAADAADLAWHLIVDSLIFHAEAEIHWLDYSEVTLERAAAAGVQQGLARVAQAGDAVVPGMPQPGAHR